MICLCLRRSFWYQTCCDFLSLAPSLPISGQCRTRYQRPWWAWNFGGDDDRATSIVWIVKICLGWATFPSNGGKWKYKLGHPGGDDCIAGMGTTHHIACAFCLLWLELRCMYYIPTSSISCFDLCFWTHKFTNKTYPQSKRPMLCR